MSHATTYSQTAQATAAFQTQIQVGSAVLDAQMALPEHARGIVLFAHGSGSGRNSPRNRYVADQFNQRGFGTLLLDLLTMEEANNRDNVFDIALLTKRLLGATMAVRCRRVTKDLPVAYFGASTGAAAALWAATQANNGVRAIVSRGGRPDLVLNELPRVQAPTLFIVGGNDRQVLELNRKAQSVMHCKTGLRVVPGATHLFEEPGAMDQVVQHASEWLERYL
jgi:putative phosphoribosyl transferase